MNDLRPVFDEILSYWFGTLDDTSVLDRTIDPFKTQFQRWYGKSPEIDAEIRERFEPVLIATTQSADAWRAATRQAGSSPRFNLALSLLIDQLPRNMYRDTPRMYAFDGLALSHAYHMLESLELASLTLVERMFACVPLMHVEDLQVQRLMERRFEELAEDAADRSPHNQGFFDYALDFARRHRIVVERFGRFPHRNEILGRTSTEVELGALRDEDIRF